MKAGTDARPLVVPDRVARRQALTSLPEEAKLADEPVLSAPEDGGQATAPAAMPPVGRPAYVPALDGLRALSVAAVIAYHLDRLGGGFLGVDVFFAVSGFLITRLLLAERERSGRIALGSFWVRRFKRLVPALLVVLAAVAIGSKLWLPAWRLTDIRTDALAALAYVANWRFVLSGQSYFAAGVTPSPLRHTWSLAIEEQFYLLWPLIVVGAAGVKHHPRRVVGVLAAVGAIASATWMTVAAIQGRDLSRLYYGTDSRVFAILAGAWLASWWDPYQAKLTTRAARRRSGRRWSIAAALGLVVLGVSFVFGTNAEPAFYQGGFQAVALVSTLVVAAVAGGRGPVIDVLGSRPLVWVGRRSYGIYLWSWPVQVMAQEHFKLEGWTLDAVVVAVTVSAATLSHWLIEQPVLTGKRPAGLPARAPREPNDVAEVRAPRVPRPVWSALAVAVVAGVVVLTAVGAPSAPAYTSVSDQEALDAAVGDISAAEAKALREATTTTIPIDEGPPGPFSEAPDYVVDPAASVDPTVPFGRPMRVLVVGDSVGWSLGWGLGDDLNPGVVPDDRAVIGCGLMPPTAQFIVGDRAPEQYPDLCTQAGLAELKGFSKDPDVVLLWIGAWEVYDQVLDGTTYRVGTDEYAELLSDQIQQRVDGARGTGAATVIPLVPCFGANAARLGKERLDPERIEWVNDQLREVAKRNRGWVRLIDPTPKLCDAEGTSLTATPEGIPLREDGSHFDPPAATWFWNAWLAGQMGAAFDVGAPPPSSTTTDVPPTPGETTTTIVVPAPDAAEAPPPTGGA